MCGIAALISDKYEDPSYIKKMTDAIIHRGPDSQGQMALYEGRIYLGHCRLSILDLSQMGNQPMSDLSGRYWITYNGEIYNYIEIREELMQLGYRFKSNSDTEVIMAAYDHWGKGCLHKFNGMWAFVLIDVKKCKLFAARDRFGVKPFYLWKSSEGFWAFASEIKQFTVLPGWESHINGQRVYDFLNWGLAEHTDETLFNGVFQLRGGQAFECSIGDMKNKLPIEQWYVLKPQHFNGNIYDAIDRFSELFGDAVRLRLRADVPVGSCLSGGLDSSSIVCMVNELLCKDNLQERQRTVSACAAVEKYNERKYIDEVIKQRNISGFYTYPSLEFLFDSLDEITWHQDEPFGSTSIYAQWCVFKTAAEKNLKVMLDGQGADEQLAGYHSFFAPRFTKLLKALHWISLYKEMLYCKKIHHYSIWHMLKGMTEALLPENICNLLRNHYCYTVLSPGWLNMKRINARPMNPIASVGGKGKDITGLSIAQLTACNLQKLLHWEDRNSMSHSIETRLPFLDYRLVEYVLGLPDAYKINKGITKRILRESMAPLLPASIQMRMDKMGFVTPEEVWMKQNKDLFLQHVYDAVDLSQGIINENMRIKAIAILEGNEQFSFLLWRIISFGNWMKIYQLK